MNTANLKDMVKGWFVGDFDPVVLRSAACEVAVKRYRAGEREALHHHRVATELTLVVSGRVRMNGREFATDAIVLLAPGEACDFEALEDTTTVVVKMPSVMGDKYEGRA